MKRTNFMVLILLGTLLSSIAFGQVYLSNETLITSDRSMLESSLKFSPVGQDSFEFEYEKSPGKAFLLSAIVPGAGEYYAGAKWRALAFVGVEVFSWAMYLNRKGKGEDLEKEYLKYADNYWDFAEWMYYSYTNKRCGPEGSHHIWVNFGLWDSLEQNWISDPEEFMVDGNFSYDSLFQIGLDDERVIRPITTRDYYENIGKYDQFACGWIDYYDNHIIGGELVNDTVFVTPRRNNYLGQRKDSNDALKMATNFATVIMFNHLISAFHAQIAAKNYSSEAEKVSWHVGIVTDVRQKNPFRGLSLSVAF